MPRLRKKKKTTSGKRKKPTKTTHRNRPLAHRKKLIEQKILPPHPALSPKGGEGKGNRIPICSRRQELPSHYGDNHIYLMVRDSHWLYAYWEIRKDHQQRCLALLGGDWSHVKSILRVYDITEKKATPVYFDIALEGLTSHWYIHARPNRSFVIEIGLLHQDGRFVILARSNEQTTPRDGMSEVLDEKWMGIDFDKMYALSGGFEVGKSSLELKKLMEKRLWGAVSSGSGVSQISSVGAR